MAKDGSKCFRFHPNNFKHSNISNITHVASNQGDNSWIRRDMKDLYIRKALPLKNKKTGKDDSCRGKTNPRQGIPPDIGTEESIPYPYKPQNLAEK